MPVTFTFVFYFDVMHFTIVDGFGLTAIHSTCNYRSVVVL